MALIFISYDRDSQEKVRTLKLDLEELNHEVWLDEQVTGGHVWWDTILNEIQRCDTFVYALDPEALDSEACRIEFRYARNLERNILPVIIADGVSPEVMGSELAGIQCVDYRLSETKAAYIALGRALKQLPQKPPLPETLPERPAPPFSYLVGIAETLDAPSLSYQVQNEILLQLKTGFRSPRTNEAARILLAKLAERYDIVSAIEEEIKSLLAPRKLHGTKWVEKVLIFLGIEVRPSAEDEPYVGLLSFKQVWLSLLGGLVVSGILAIPLVRDSSDTIERFRVFLRPWWSLPAVLLLLVSVIWKKLAFRPAYARLALLVFPPMIGFALRAFINTKTGEISWTKELRKWEAGLAGAVFALIVVMFVFWKETPQRPLGMKQACMSLAGGIALLIVLGSYTPSHLPVVAVFERMLAVAFAVYAVILLAWNLMMLIKRRKARKATP